jgi:hypothetical protein
MCWGFPGDGWFLLIDNLCKRIQCRIDQSEEQAARYLQFHNTHLAKEIGPYTHAWSPWMQSTSSIPQVVADQVKEKFGTLRFYYHGGDETIGGYIRMAEHLSTNICETCGKFSTEVGHTTGWIITMCQNCAKESNKLSTWRLSEDNSIVNKLTF